MTPFVRFELEDRARRQLWWKPPVRKFWLLALAGLAIVMVSLGVLLYIVGTAGGSILLTRGGWILISSAFVGLAIAVAGATLRNKATRKIMGPTARLD